MKTRGKLLLVLLAAVILLYAVFVLKVFDSVSFENGLNKIESMEKGIGFTGLVPEEKQKLKDYQLELTDIETEFSGKNQNKDLKALNYLIDVKKELILMKLNLIELEETNNCSERIELIDSVRSSAISARDSINNYITNYSDFSEKTEEFNSDVLDTTSSVIISFKKLREDAVENC